MDSNISTSIPPTGDKQARIDAINTQAERLKNIAEEAAKTGKLPDFGRPYEELTDIERQLYDIALRRQALEKQILNSIWRRDESVRQVCDRTEDLRGQILDTGKSSKGLEKKLSNIVKKISGNKVIKFLNRVFEYCLYCKW